MLKRVLITGATGLIGKHICQNLMKRGDEIIIVSRSNEKAKNAIPGAKVYIDWEELRLQGKNYPCELLEGIDAVINLAGENVMSKRWTEKQKEKILNSRVLGTKKLIEIISKLSNKPECFLSASAIGYYGNSEIVEFTEDDEPSDNFLGQVTKCWEEEVKKINKINDIREVRIRLGIILDKKEGAFVKFIPQFKYFLGGTLGGGTQWFPWIHIHDVVSIFLFALDNKNVVGPVNAVAPEFINMKEFCLSLGKTMRRPSILKIPKFLLRIALGESAAVITSGAKIKPAKLIALGYKFKFTKIEKAQKDLLT
ncbi:TIGR01777 family oxidoreductase [Bacteroidota bacterium]